MFFASIILNRNRIKYCAVKLPPSVEGVHTACHEAQRQEAIILPSGVSFMKPRKKERIWKIKGAGKAKIVF